MKSKRKNNSEPTINDYAKKVRKLRKGSRGNKDGTESTVLMTYAEADGKYYAYPTLFQNEDGSWVEMSDKNNWAAMKEAIKRGEIYEFPTEVQAKDFAEGSWKKKEKLARKPLAKYKSNRLM